MVETDSACRSIAKPTLPLSVDLTGDEQPHEVIDIDDGDDDNDNAEAGPSNAVPRDAPPPYSLVAPSVTE